MIIPPREWHRSAGAHRLVLEPRDGGGRIVYQERLSLQSFAHVVRRRLEEEPDFTATSTSPIERLVTEEGEYAAWLSITGRWRGLDTRWSFGGVCLDEFVAAIDGLAMQRHAIERIAGMTRRLLLEATYGLDMRRRRPVYAPPLGWGGVPNGLTTSWYPQDFPAHAARIVVPPAFKSTETPMFELERLVADDTASGFNLTSPLTFSRVTAREGLAGSRCSYAGGERLDVRRRRFDVVVLGDGRYIYPCWLESAADTPHDIATFEAVFASFEALPLGGARTAATPAGNDVLGSWID